MINHLDNLLRHLLMTEVEGLVPSAAGPVTEDQVGFQPPDEDWRTHVSGLGTKNALNAYLADLRENRKLRSNERVRHIENGLVSEEPAPARLDCHYLITAWSPANVSPAIEPTLDEHALLYQVAGVLMNHAPLNPSRIYAPGSAALAAVPELIREADLPTLILPVEGFPKLAEFWGTMGTNHRWRPAVYLVVTLPVALQAEIAGPLVTTRVTEFRQADDLATVEVGVQIGGRALGPQVAVVRGQATLSAASNSQATVTLAADAANFRPGDTVFLEEGTNNERATIASISGPTFTFLAELTHTYTGGTLRIADLNPGQRRIRVASTIGAEAGTAIRIAQDTTSESGVAGSVDQANNSITLAQGLTNTYTMATGDNPVNIVHGIADALVEITDAGLRARTDATGRYTFPRVPVGTRTVRVVAVGFQPQTQSMEVPNQFGDYDIVLNAL